jgi:hypothetical protein
MNTIKENLELMDINSDEADYVPDFWSLLQFINDGQLSHKILSGWNASGGYGESWELSDEIEATYVDIGRGIIMMQAQDGSTFLLHKGKQQMKMITSAIFSQLKDKFGPNVIHVEV